MTRFTGSGRFAIVLAVAGMLGLQAAHAQEPSKEQLDAARAAISALHATDQFDNILPNGAEALKNQLIQAAPNLEKEISATVDAQALEMAGRRADLEREAASIYAKSFSVDELKAIAEFYNSPAGKKLIETGPLVTRELLKAAEIWSNGVGRDLANATNKALQASLGKSAAPDTTQAPATGAAAPAAAKPAQ